MRLAPGSLALLLAMSLAVAGCRAPARILEIRDLDAAEGVMDRLPVGAQGLLELTFTHSMYGGWVAESYAVGPELRRIAVRTEMAAAAEYYARYGNTRPVADGWLVEVAPLALARLLIRVDRVGDPALSVAGRRVALLSLVPDGHLVEVRVAQ